MKQLLVSLIVAMSLISCKKDETSTVVTPQSATSSIYSKSADDGHEGEEDEGQCCSFRYGQWDSCSDGYQVRTWTSRSATCIPPLDSIQRSCESIIIQYLYYNASYTSLRVVSNRPGLLHIYNSTGQLTSVLNYNAGGNWIQVSFLPIGNYTVTAGSRTAHFVR